MHRQTSICPCIPFFSGILSGLPAGTPQNIIDNLGALMNALTMIHSISRHYNTTERMTNFFIKITNQVHTEEVGFLSCVCLVGACRRALCVLFSPSNDSSL